MTAVAVWDHHPSADELLEARLKAGWTPTPSALKEGDAVLGHAACAVTVFHSNDQQAQLPVSSD
ncbi:MAG: hypothetical protein M3362_11430 [Acidobacteriota bacterium]|nr:hypothetical protein [Acidobacteriota bacterium]